MDTARITRKEPKPDNNGHKNGKSTQKPEKVNKVKSWKLLAASGRVVYDGRWVRLFSQLHVVLGCLGYFFALCFYNQLIVIGRSIGKDYRLALAINRVSIEVNNVVNQRALFIKELDSLGVRYVPSKLLEFLKEIQMLVMGEFGYGLQIRFAVDACGTQRKQN
nr:hypothetical protein [Tanacetum cinerariifolium]